ncbi:copper chaperone [Roseovarius azorensis]|uniref:Copper chaperone n=1 Tax=Roseovarius azorensis TaxID=1287727 RepID=A0A1H7SIB0_9RHOB|nr:heavy-metal-associated domain-containing protein [Roseovarius azorensis]SEL71886.1 copper chaperone [Roseovarius azorensis]
MSSFNVPDMSCGHCTAAIEKAIKVIDPTAKVACDLGTRTVAVESFLGDRAVSEAIRNAGYDVAAPAAP